MTLTAAGNLGIGTSSPENKLDVRGIVSCTNAGADATLTEVIRFARSDYPDFYHSIFASSGSGSSDQHKLDFRLNTGSSNTVTSRMTLVGNGNVGIGTSSPIATQSGVDISSGGLSLIIGADNGSSTRTNAGNKSGRFAMAHYTNAEEPFAIALCDVTSTTNELSIGGGSGACNTATVVKFFTAANNTTVSGSERMRIDSAGSVGIGTSSPSTLLDVRGEVSVAYNATYGLRFYNQDRNNWSSIGCTVATGNASANLVFKDSTGIVATMTGGNVGIGTSSPNARLEALSSTAGAEISRFEGNYPASGTVNLTNWRRSGGAVASVMRYNDANTDMEFGTTTSHSQAFITGGTERMPASTPAATCWWGLRLAQNMGRGSYVWLIPALRPLF
jgi:hypothetical protein